MSWRQKSEGEKMNKWIAEFDLEDGDTMPEHMDLEYKGARIDFHCRPLEQEPTAKNDLGVDAVSRKQAIEEADKLCLETGYDNEKVIEMLNELPSVTPIRPKGYWKTRPLITFCSECGFELKIDNTNYCPNCGAKMESEG